MLAAVLGATVCAALIARSGAAAVAHGVLALARMMPIVFALEAARIAAETWSTHALLGANARMMRFAKLLRAQLLCSALSTVMPAGRTVGEAGKAAVLSEALPTAAAASVGALGQLLALLFNGALCLGGAVLAARRGFTGFALACCGFGALLLLGALVLIGAARSATVARWLARWRRTAGWSQAFLQATRSARPLSAPAVSAQLLARAAQLAQLALLAAALRHPHPLRDAPLLQAIYLLGASAGDLVPAQLGTIDAAFGLARSLLGMAAPSAIALGLALHVVQLTSAGACFAAVLLLQRREHHRTRTRSRTWET